MDDLVQQATSFLQKNYKKPIHTVASALRTATGKTYLGLNIDHFSGFVCAETSALATAINDGQKAFTEIVAVRREPDGAIGVANPCGKCRQILHDYAPGIQLAVVDEMGGVEVHSIEELLPFSFKRQREKIQMVMNDEGIHEIIG